MRGLDIFREHFAGADHNYVLIGGAACEIIMREVELDFRTTKDLDLVLLVESLDKTFGEKFWAFVEAGGYQQRERSAGDKEFYRFHSPENAEYPTMLELFARAPDSLQLAEGATLTPLPIDEDIASLSAILLDQAYYDALKQHNRVVDGVAVLDERMLVPFKAKAHLDLAARKEAGARVDSSTIRKHRADVFRLLQLLAANERIELSETIKDDLRAFGTKVAADGDFKPKDVKLTNTLEELLDKFAAIYML